MFTIPSILITILEGIVAVLGAYIVVFWFAMVLWTFQDIRRRTRDWLVRIICVLLVMVFTIPGLIIYLIVRPQDTVAGRYEQQLEEEALLQGMEEKLACPSCHKRAQADFAVCPHCGERLKQPCVSCGKLLNLNWTVCPFCETPNSQPTASLETQATDSSAPADPATA